MGNRAAPKPRRVLSRRNIMLYGLLIFAALYYLLPLYVMVVTSLKGMPEIRLGNIFSPPVEITFEPWVKAWATACTGLNCDGLSRGFWNSVRITVPSTADLDPDRLGQRLCARQLALQGGGSLLHDPDRRRLHPLSGDDLSDRHRAARNGHLRHADRARSSCTPSSACRS
jgi:hypothetical protein